MKIAIFSDIHGNLPAFKLMLKDAGKVDQYISLGDVVNYGPWSNECVQLLMSLKNCIKLRGNAEDYFINQKYSGSNKLASLFFNVCVKNFTEFKAIKEFKTQYQLNRFILIHTINNTYIYSDSKIKLTQNYVIGHSHYQFKLESNGYELYSPGSVGQNRKYINVINYSIYDSKEKTFTMKQIAYDVDQVIKEMKTRYYPDQCIEYYAKKKRF